jgi:hypothetical protein
MIAMATTPTIRVTDIAFARFAAFATLGNRWRFVGGL